jgi:hypothetical protein
MEKDKDNKPSDPSDSEWYLEDLVDHRTFDMDEADFEEAGAVLALRRMRVLMFGKNLPRA